jgi:hypothetical protein
MLPPLLLAVSRQMLEAKIEARTLCLLPSRTERQNLMIFLTLGKGQTEM